jgi:hypothetical protein
MASRWSRSGYIPDVGVATVDGTGGAGKTSPTVHPGTGDLPDA